MRLYSLLLLFLFCSPIFAEVSSKLPIEVLGKPGHIEKATVILKDDPKEATGIRFRMHGLTYENKCSIKINDEDWLTLNDANVIYPKVEAAFWGMGGTQATLNFTVPIKRGVLKDSTTILFRFNDIDHKTVGFRVLNIEIMAGSKVLKIRNFPSIDNPAFWKPISTNREDIIMGRELWYNATLRDNGVLLRAKCTDCHFENGTDLQLLNYSDKSIIARSMFHELSLEDSKKIAIYIRNLKVPYLPTARPWNGNFQPGPGMSLRPAYAWIGGSGIVLTNDLDTLKYIFPEGLKNSHVSFKDTLTVINIPLAMQMPTWNQYLPEVHPMDAFPEIYTNGFPYIKIYSVTKEKLKNISSIEGAKYFKKQASNWDRANVGGPIHPLRDASPEYADFIKKYAAVQHWRFVKSLELCQEFNLFDYGIEVFGGVQPRLYPSYSGEPFRLADHMLKGVMKDSFYTQSTMWYMLQLNLNDGNRSGPTITPIDWGYLLALNFSAWNNPIKMPTYGIAVLNAIKAGEIVENGINITNKMGWNPYTTKIDLLLGKNFGAQMKQVDIETRREVARILLDAWMDKADTYSKEDYENSRFFKDDGVLDFNYLIKFKISQSRLLGVDQETIDRYSAFGKKIFPFDTWEK